MKGKADVTAEDFIPQHRIQYFKVKTTGVIIWDKRSGVDAVFGTGKPQMRMHGATTASISEMECGATL